MKFPNKVTTYKQSILYKFPIVLEKLETRDYLVLDLYEELKKDVSDLAEFTQILDCLFYLKKIELVSEERRLHFVKDALL